MNRIEFHTFILENGHISLPTQIMEQFLLKPRQPVKVTIETQQLAGTEAKRYSFQKVRNLLKGIKGEMSAEIIADRDDRI